MRVCYWAAASSGPVLAVAWIPPSRGWDASCSGVKTQIKTHAHKGVVMQACHRSDPEHK